ncbi:MAG: hypothetical protein M0Z61_06495 [Nitrospiraceae bacterium]|nr:hypothetical protein [Nitrospiraceae bacterium]
MANLVWYVSYGSNLDKDRFMCYINGGRPEGSSKSERGCRDKTPPKASKTATIPFPLYFAKQSFRWDNKGVAFIGLTKTEIQQEQALGRMYLINEEQFICIVSQENGNSNISIDLDEVKRNGSKVFKKKSWYGNIVYLGDKDGYPKFTFTISTDIGVEPFVAPSDKYLRTLISGLRQIYKLSKAELVKYLLEKPGVQGFYNSAQISSLINQD